MKSKIIGAFIVIAFVVACNETANQSQSSSADSAIRAEPHNTSVDQGTADSSRNRMQDSAMKNMDSINMNKR